ncbi:hypothetical protein IG631_11168 [Alternaria alternata]|nr:hypothetical protein IG631_11168 [Alternaria alternata]
MSDFNGVSFTDQNSTHRVREEDQDRHDDHCVFPDVRHMKGSEGKPGAKRKLHDLAQDSDSTNEQYDDGRRDPKRIFHPSETSILVSERRTSFQSKDICDECRSLNLGVLIKKVQDVENRFVKKHYAAPWEYSGSPPWLRARVAFRYRQRQYGCPLCRELAASRITPGTSSNTEETKIQDEGDEIWVDYYHAYTTFLSRSLGARKIAIRLFLVPHGSTMTQNFPIDRMYGSGSLILIDSSTDPQVFDPQPISPSFDPGLVSSWLNYCTRYHRLLCHSEPLPVHGVKIIDCATLQIKDHNGNTPYVSLSYVWGKSKDVCGPVETIVGHKTLPQLLPPVIRDSIQVTKALGFQYLWVDKFCIDQDAADLKHEQIQQMDAIYKNSQLTIIGAAGQDESHGLPGVGARGRSHNFLAEFDGATVFWYPNDPHTVISESHWSTRGWTFQEALLSRRRLVFTDDQVYFQCNTMNCFESNHCPLDEIHVKDRSKTREFIRSGIFGRGKHERYGKLVRDKESLNESFRRYLSSVEHYTGRNLSFDEDSLNAFQGIIKQFSQERYAFNHVWGLAYPSNGPRSLDMFVHSLTWMHRAKTKARRRNLFPSWTWAGWEGRIAYEVSLGKNIRFDNALDDLRFKGMADGSLSLEELGEHRSHAVLCITATALSLGPKAYTGAEKVGASWRIAGREAILSWSTGDHTNAELAEMFKDTSRWQFVYIGAVLKNFFVMILELGESGRTWQRVGMFRVGTYHRTFKERLLGKHISTYEIE